MHAPFIVFLSAALVQAAGRVGEEVNTETFALATYRLCRDFLYNRS